MSAGYRITESAQGILYEDSIENVSLSLPLGSARVDFRTVDEPEAGDFDKMMTLAMAAPYGAPRLREIAEGRRSAAIIVSDATRAVQTPLVLPYIVEELQAAGIGLDQIKIVVAIGVHRKATEQEMKNIAGIYHGKIAVENHDPYDQAKLTAIGKTSFGTTVEVNSGVCASDLKISIGKVEPHEFAGYSGGRKSVLPGISSESCIVHNHRPEMILNPNSVAGVLQGNPIHMDMLEAAKTLGIDFTVNLVQNAKGEPIGVFAGNLQEAHERGVEFVNEHFGIRLHPETDIYVVTPGYPLNIDLYQSVKALIALTPVVKKGDVILFYSKCTEGVNSEDMVRPFSTSTDLDDVLRYVTENYKIQMDHALLLCKLYQKGVRVVACTPGVEDGVLSLMHMVPAQNLQHAWETALSLRGDRQGVPNVSVIPMPQRAIIKI